MLPTDGESDRFLAAKDLKLVGQRHGKFVFCYVVRILLFWPQLTKPAVSADRGEIERQAQTSVFSAGGSRFQSTGQEESLPILPSLYWNQPKQKTEAAKPLRRNRYFQRCVWKVLDSVEEPLTNTHYWPSMGEGTIVGDDATRWFKSQIALTILYSRRTSPV